MDKLPRKMVAETLPDGTFVVRTEEYDPQIERQTAIEKVAKRTLEQLGVSADSAYVSHRDVVRAAHVSAQLALQGVDIEHIWQLLREEPGRQATETLGGAEV